MSHSKAILAIDAAWTATEPSGVSLVQKDGGSWKCIALAPSYASFLAAANGFPVDWSAPAVPSRPDVANLLAAAQTLVGAHVDLVAIDMPVAMSPITCRRAADDAISKKYGDRGCSVHSPTAVRPGKIADDLCLAFATNGYPLATTVTASGTSPALLEVFPHTALLTLLSENYRVPYKLSRTRRYWPLLSPVDRRAKVLAEWDRILAALGRTINGIVLAPGAAVRSVAFKRYEDAIDALICAWVGIAYLEGRAIAYGDVTAAIWSR